MNKRERDRRKKQISQYADMDAEQPLSEAGQRRMNQLIAIDRAEEIKAAGRRGVVDFRKMDIGEDTERGVIIECPVCHRNGAARSPKFWPGATFIVHTLEPVAALPDLVIIGKDFTDAGAGGKLQATDFHVVAADGTPVMPRERKTTAKPSKEDTDPQPPVAKKQTAPKSTSRSEAAKRAWITIRKNREAKQKLAA
jgi:hypothetical protein